MGCCSSCHSSALESELAVELNNAYLNEHTHALQISHNTLIELILIKRILFNTKPQMQSPVQHVIDQHGHSDDMNKHKCQVILSNLEKYTINEYMMKYYDDSQCLTIDWIFKNIIIKHYPNEYTNQISSNSTSTSTYTQDTTNSNSNSCIVILSDKYTYQSQLFNQSDLIQTIFKYLDLNSVNVCSLVNFVWLFHAFNVNVINELPLDRLMRWNPKKNNPHQEIKSIVPVPLSVNRSHVPVTVWQRFYNAQQISYIDLVRHGDHETCASQLVDDTDMAFKQFWDNLSCLDNIRKFVYLSNNYRSTPTKTLPKIDRMLFETISKQCSKIVELNVSIVNDHDHDDEFDNKDDDEHKFESPVFELNSVKSIRLETVPISFICTDKCQSLDFNNIYLTQTMLNLMINDNCNLTGIKTLKISNIQMKDTTQNINNITIIGHKMINLKDITIGGGITSAMQTLCQALKPMIVTNSCNMTVRLDHTDTLYRTKNFFDMINSEQLGTYLSDIVIDATSRFEGVLLRHVLSNKTICSHVKVLRFECLGRENKYTNGDGYSYNYVKPKFTHFEKYLNYQQLRFQKFDRLSHVECDFELHTESDCSSFVKFLDLAKRFILSNYKRPPFWRFYIKIQWKDNVFGYTVEESTSSISYAHATAERNWNPHPQLEQLEDTLPKIFDGILKTFIHGMIPIDFTMLLRYQPVVLNRMDVFYNKYHDNGTTKKLAHFYETHYKPSFDSTFKNVGDCRRIYTKISGGKTDRLGKVLFRVRTVESTSKANKDC